MLRRRRVLGLMCCAVAGLLAPAMGVRAAGARGPTAQNVFTMSGLSGIWCRPDGTCLAAGRQPDVGAIGLMGASGVGAVRRVPGTRNLNAVACRPDGDCTAVGEGTRGTAAVVDVAGNGTPRSVTPVSGATTLYDVDCPTPETCVATGTLRVAVPYEVNEYGSVFLPVFVVATNGVPGPAQRYPRSFRSVTALDCPTATRCVAVGSGDSAVLTASGGSWTARATTPAFGAADISCPTASSCYVTAYGSVSTAEGSFAVPAIREVSADGVPGTRRVLSDRSASLQGISCVADWTCTLVGLDNTTTRGFAIDVTPSGPPVLTVWDNSNYFSDVSCISAGVCGLVGAAAGAPPLPVFAWKG